VKTDYESVKDVGFTMEDMQQLANHALETYTPPSNLVEDAVNRIVVADPGSKMVSFATMLQVMGVARLRHPQIYGHLPL